MRPPAPLFASFTPACLAALLLASSAPNTAWADTRPPLVPAEVETGGLTVRIHPNQIRIDRSRRFDDEGRTQQLNNRLSVYFQCVVTSEHPVLAYRDLGVDRLRDGWDREVALPDPGHRGQPNWVTLQPNRHQAGNDAAARFSFGFNTEAPAADVQVLSEVGGRIELRVAAGELQAIRLSPLGDFLGKRLRVRDMDDTRLRVDRTQERGEAGVKLSLPAERMSQIREVRFFTANGRRLPSGNASSQRRQGTIESRLYRGTPPDDGTMEIHVYPEISVLEVPWTVRDVPLPAAADPGPGEELALDTQPLGAGSQLPGLDVEVEE